MSVNQETPMASTAVLKVLKKDLRSLLRHRLSKIPPDSIQSQSAAVFERVIASSRYQNSKRVGIYLSMPTGELQTDQIVRHALGSGKQVFVPYLHKTKNQAPDTPRSVMEMVDIRSLSDYNSLERDSWGIPTIGADTVETREHILGGLEEQQGNGLDLILMPGVAFDIDPKDGGIRRLGHGKGFYDYFLHRYHQAHVVQPHEETSGRRTNVFLYGLALQEQFLHNDPEQSVPVGPSDYSLDGLFLGNGSVMEKPRGRELD